MEAARSIPIRPALGLLALAYAAFVSLGLPDGVLGVVWPSVRTSFGLPQSALGAVLAGGGVGYFLSGLAAGGLIGRLGVGGLLAVSTGLVSLALFGYAASPSWPLLVACAPLVGLGSGAIDAALNAYAASRFSARHVNWLHAFFGVGATTGPLIATLVLAQGWSWRWGYAIVGATLLLLAFAFAATRGRWEAGPSSAAPQGGAVVPASAALRHPLVWLQVAVFFVYTGLEFGLGQWSYTVLSEGRGVPAAQAGVWVSLYWGGLTAGRLVLGAVVDRLGPDRLLRLATAGALLGCLLFAGGLGPGGAALVLVGFCLAPVYPTLMARTPLRLGEGVSAHAVGYQVSAATLGGVALPSLAGVLAAGLGLTAVGWLAAGAAAALLLLHELLLRLSR